VHTVNEAAFSWKKLLNTVSNITRSLVFYAKNSISPFLQL